MRAYHESLYTVSRKRKAQARTRRICAVWAALILIHAIGFAGFYITTL